VRSGGKGAVADVLAGARALAQVLWTRESETGRFDTPERRAKLEARINQVTASIGHDAVRRYYDQDLKGRLRDLFVPAARQAGPGPARRFADKRAPRSGRYPAEQTQVVQLSPRLAASSIVRGSRTTLPAREALILLALINHPWLLESHAEDVATLEFLNPDTDLLRRTILDAATHGTTDAQDLRALIAAREHGPLLARIERSVTHPSDWPARDGAAAEDVRQWWTHILTLHRRTRTLNKELKDAERALGDEPSDQNLAWLRDVQDRLSALDGTEASIEGFGTLSGRPMRSL
jgi:DNA primase